MKYLITESQRENVVFKYLDNQDFIVYEYGASTYFANSEGDGFAQIKYGGKHRNEELCFIYKKLVSEVSSFFNLKDYQTIRIIGEWVKKELNLSGEMSNKMVNMKTSVKIPIIE